jgi:hypothetical protein
MRFWEPVGQSVTNRTLSDGRLPLAQSLLPGDAQGMDLRPQAPEIPSADEVSIDDLLAGVRTTAELNELIREGLAAARRGGQDFPRVHP